MEKEQLARFEEILERFADLGERAPQRRETFMSVSGYPHYENVVSNILAFFFSDGSHGFGNLWASSLLKCAGIDEREADAFVVDDAEREVGTGRSNRIDLVISGDGFRVAIENKIFADLYNDLGDYRQAVEQKLDDEAQGIFIVLSLKDLSGNTKLLENGFVNVTYRQLFTMVRSCIGEYMDQADNTWLAYMKDFMYELEGFEEDRSMDYEATKFIYRDYEESKALFDFYKHYKKKTKKDIESLMEEFKGRNQEYCQGPHNLWVYQSGYFYTALIDDISLPEGHSIIRKAPKSNLAVECWPDGELWHFTVWVRNGRELGGELRRMLMECGFEVVEDTWLGDKRHNGAELKTIPLESSDEEVFDAFKWTIDAAMAVVNQIG